MSYPAGAPLPSSKIILIILDGNMSDGIVPEYLENKSLSKSFVKIISLFLEKFSTMENLIKVDTGLTGEYTKVGGYTYVFPKSYKKVLGVAINVCKSTDASSLENVYLSSFNNTSFSFVKDCVNATKPNTVKVYYTVFYTN